MGRSPVWHNWSYHATPAPVLEFGCRANSFVLVSNSVFTFSRAPRASPGTIFFSATLICFTFLSYAASPFVRIRNCVANLRHCSVELFMAFSAFLPPLPPSHFTEERQAKYALFFLWTTASTMYLFFRERYVCLTLVRGPHSHRPSVLFCLTYRTTYSFCNFRSAAST